jgi:DNA-binding LacI/PurR family transcriptional regulator
MGEIAVKLLLDQIRNAEKSEPKRIVLKPKLIIRESVGHFEPSVGTNSVLGEELVPS